MNCPQNGRPRWISSTGAVVVFGKKTRKPNSVYAVIPLGAALPRTLISDLPGGFGNGSSRLAASGRCAAGAWLLAPASLPIWSCSVWGLPCHSHYWLRGALLPHHFTLTPAWGSPLDKSIGGPRMPSQRRGSRGGMFSVALAVHGPLRPRPGRYPAHCPAEFGLSSPGNPCLRKAFRQRPPGPPARH